MRRMKAIMLLLLLALYIGGCSFQEESAVTAENEEASIDQQEEKDEFVFGPEESTKEKLLVYIPGIENTIGSDEGEKYSRFPSFYHVGTYRSGGDVEAVQGNAFAQAIMEYSEKENVPIEIRFIQEYQDGKELLQAVYETGEDFPDLMITGKHTMYDFRVLADQNILLDFGTVMTDDAIYDDALYYAPVVQGGKINDKQYVLPLLFNLNGLITSEEYLKEIGVSFSQESVDYEAILAALSKSCTEMVHSKTIEAIAETSGRAQVGYYLPSILMGAAYPDYLGTGRRPPQIDQELLTKVFELQEEFYEQEFVNIPDWKGENFGMAKGSLEKKETGVYRLRTEGFQYVGMFLSGGRAGGLNFHNNILTDAAFFHSLYANEGKKMVFQGIPTLQDENAYSANITAMLMGFQSTKQPEEVYKLARYLMDYEFSTFYGLSVNREITEKQLTECQSTEIKLPSDTAWIMNRVGKTNQEQIEAETRYLNPLNGETVETLRYMLDHLAGAGLPYAPLEFWLYWGVLDALGKGILEPEEAAAWVVEHLTKYQEVERRPFESMQELLPIRPEAEVSHD